MAEPITLIMLGEPVAFARTRHRGSLHFTPTKQRNASAVLRLIAQQEMGEREPFDVPCSLDLLCEMAIPHTWSQKKRLAAVRGELYPGKRPDWDNLGKLTADALNKIVYRDDALIVWARVRKVYGVQPKIVVTVSPLIGDSAE